MRSNSGHGKSNHNLRDPTMKDHEEARRDDSERGPAQAHHGDLEPAGSDGTGEARQPAAGPVPKH